MSPLIPSALAIAMFCGALAGILIWCAFEIVRGWVRAWRAERQLQNRRDHLLSLRSFNAAKRLGYLPEDVQ